jgi:hypothetical protein
MPVIKSRKMSLARHIIHMGQMRNVYKILVGIPPGKRTCGRPTHRWGIISNWILNE